MHFLSLSCILLLCIVITNAQVPPPMFPRPLRNRPALPRNIPIPVRQYVVENEIKVHEITHFKRPKPGLKARRNRLPTPNIMKGSCQQSGCPQGLECVLQGSWVCPRWIPSLPCQCRPGCRHMNILIKPGETKRIDNCGSTCSCYSMKGTVTCKHKNC